MIEQELQDLRAALSLVREHGLPISRPRIARITGVGRPQKLRCPYCPTKMRASEGRRFYGHLRRHGWKPESFVRKTNRP